jgi:hypothetical protein
MPEARGDDDVSDEEGDITDDIGEVSDVVRKAVASELGAGRKNRAVQEPHSPLRKRTETRTMKRKEAVVLEALHSKKSRSAVVEVPKTKNSDLFPADIRP